MPPWFYPMLETLPHIPGFILAFFIVFLVHEFGHYGVARLFNMKIEAFSIGIGRTLYTWYDKRGTRWTFHLIPLKGYVTIADLNITDDTPDEAVQRRPVWQRILVVLAGPFSNLILPFFLFFLCFSLVGFPHQPPVITAVEEGLPAQKSGLMPGDTVLKVDGRSIRTYGDLGHHIKDSNGHDVSLLVKRNDTLQTLSVTPLLNQYTEITGIERERYKIGVLNALNPLPLKFIHTINGIDTKENENLSRQLILDNLDQEIRIGMYSSDNKIHPYRVVIPSHLNTHLDNPKHRYYDAFYFGPLTTNVFSRLPFGEIVIRAMDQSTELFKHVIAIPLQLFPPDPKLFSQRVHFTGESYFTQNLLYRTFYTTALLSLLIGLINLIPLPKLDGDYLVSYMMEGILRRRPTRKQRAWAIMISVFALYCVLLFANLQDVPGYLEQKAEDISEWFGE